MNTDAGAVRLVTRLSDLERLGAGWQSIFRKASSGNPFLSWEWNQAWCLEYSATHPILFAVVESGGKLMAIAPLTQNGRTLLSRTDLSLVDYGDWLLDTDLPSALNRLLAGLHQHGSTNRLSIGPIREDSPIRTLLDAASDTGWWARRDLGTNPRVAISGSFDNYLASRSKKLRQEIRTTANHLERSGEWCFIEETQGDAARRIYDALVVFHRARQDHKPGSSVFDDDQRRRFLRDIIGNLQPSVETHLSAIEWQGRIVSAAYSLRCGSTLYYWTPSFAPELRSLSLGKLHIARLIRRCHETGLAFFDFMGGDEPYKLQWANEVLGIYEYWAFGSSAARWRTQAGWHTRDWLRRRKAQSPLMESLWRRWSKHGIAG